jgi:hypothetical protein
MNDLIKPFVMQLYDLGADLTAFQVGMPQQSGPMTVLPVFGPDRSAGSVAFVPPLSGLKLGGVKRGYGNVELHNAGTAGVAIVPLHVGYIQDGAQNHALCRSAFVGPGQHVVFEDACCVQQAQGGFLEGRDQWFFILPLTLREEALLARGVKAFGKLWPAIGRLNARLGLEQRGHLEQIVCRQRPVLTQYQSRFELLPGQTGALFLLRDRLVGVEIAPTAEYFSEVWMPLTCFCYGAAAMELERQQPTAQAPAPAEPLPATTLPQLRSALAESRQSRLRAMYDGLASAQPERFDKREEERYLGLRLFTAISQKFAGQYVLDEGRLVYASLSARGASAAGLN